MSIILFFFLVPIPDRNPSLFAYMALYEMCPLSPLNSVCFFSAWLLWHFFVQCALYLVVSKCLLDTPLLYYSIWNSFTQYFFQSFSLIWSSDILTQSFNSVPPISVAFGILSPSTLMWSGFKHSHAHWYF